MNARIFVAAAAMVVLVARSVAAQSLPYLSDSLKVPAFKATFDALFRGERNLSAWLLAYRKNRNGAEIPGRVEGGSYELYGVCEPHNCSDSYILVLFVPEGSRAWAVLITATAGQISTRIRSPNYRFFGHPNSQQRSLLTSAKW